MYHNHPQAERGSMTYPQSMSYFVKSLESLTTGTFKIPATTNSELQAHEQFSVLLPTAALIDTRGLRLNFQAKAVGGKGRLPNNMSALFSSIDVNIGGINVSSIQENGVLDQTLVNWGQKVKDPVVEKDSVNTTVSSVDLENIANAEDYTFLNDKAYFSVPLGQFFETISPSVIATAYMPTIEIIFRLASNSIISTPRTDADDFAKFTSYAEGSTPAQSTYKIKNYHVICPVMSIANNDYDALLQQTLMSRGSLELVFRNWETFSDIFNATTRASSSASSLDLLVATFRRNTATEPLKNAYTGVNPLIAVKGKNNQIVAGTSGVVAGALSTDGNNQSEFLSAPLCFTAPVPANSLTGSTFQSDPEAKFQWKINGTPQPSFAASISEWYTLSKDSWNVKKTKCTNLNEFFSNRFCAAVRLNLKESQNQRIVSGLDLRQSNSSLTFDLVQNNAYATNNDNVILLLANTSRLIVGSGKQINVIN